MGLQLLGNLQMDGKDWQAAFKSYEESLVVVRKIAARDPGNTGWQRDLSVSFEKIGDVCKARDQLDGALKNYQESLAVSERLAAADPENTLRQRDVASVESSIGKVLAMQNKKEEARKHLNRFRQTMDHIAARYPGNYSTEMDRIAARCYLAQCYDLQTASGQKEARQILTETLGIVHAAQKTFGAQPKLTQLQKEIEHELRSLRG